MGLGVLANLSLIWVQFQFWANSEPKFRPEIGSTLGLSRNPNSNPNPNPNPDLSPNRKNGNRGEKLELQLKFVLIPFSEIA